MSQHVLAGDAKTRAARQLHELETMFGWTEADANEVTNSFMEQYQKAVQLVEEAVGRKEGAP